MFKSLGAFFLDIVEVILFAVGIFFFVYLLIMKPHKISGQSMMPNFQDAQFLLTEKVTYYLHNPQRGDVVVFVPPLQYNDPSAVKCGATTATTVAPPTDEFIKRVIGVPGDKIAVRSNHVYLNGKELKESYLSDTLVIGNGPFLCEGTEYTVPEGKYFVMGDNRPNSSDSRYWGPITKSEITGRAWVSYWPLNSVGVVPKPTYN